MMQVINLFPWREEKRQREKLMLYVSMIVIFVAVSILVLCMHWFLYFKIDKQQRELNFLKLKLVQVNQVLLKRNKEQETMMVLNKEIDYLQQLSQRRWILYRLFHELTTIIPATANITLVKGQNNFIQLQGNAPKNADLFVLMQNIDKSTWLRKPELNEMESEHSQQFSLRMEVGNES